MRIIFILLFTFSLNLGLQAQNSLWTSSAEVAPASEENPSEYLSFELDYANFSASLRRAPMQYTREAKENPVVVNLPLPDGRIEPFAVVESPTMAPALAAKYPFLKSYGGQGLHDKRLVLKFTIAPEGLQAIMKTKDGLSYISPLMEGQSNLYMAYYKRHLPNLEHAVCGVDDNTILPQNLSDEKIEKEINDLESSTSLRSADVVPLRTYRLALSCTGEFADRFGGTTASVMSAFNTAVNQLNMIFEQEASITFQMIPNNDENIYLDGPNDPFVNPGLGRELLNENNVYLNDQIGSANYDVGHIFTWFCTDGVAGIASLRGTCGPFKGAGVTCHSSTNLVGTINTVMAHEIGHQFGAQHSWNHCPGSDDQRSGSTAFEPASGSTIMSYAGVCNGGQNLQSTNDIYFNNGALEQIYRFSREEEGNDCAIITQTSNNTPDLNLPYDNNFSIPMDTPFKLTAEGSDIDGDVITYCWEQHDIGPELSLEQANSLGAGAGTAPLIRSYQPSTSPTRYVPRLNDVINNFSPDSEELPKYSRRLTFRCTARDNISGNGGLTWEEMFFRTTDSAGPFRVNTPDNSTAWIMGEEKEVSWLVANTDNATVNCQKVNILLSVNGGFDFDIMLVANTPNDGTETIIVPNVASSQVRIKVEAANNIFYDMTNTNLRIEAPADPSLYVKVGSACQQVCLPAMATIDFETDALSGLMGNATYSVEGLPMGAVAVFGANPADPAAPNTLSLDLNNVNFHGIQEMTLVAEVAGAATIRRTFSVDFVSNDFSALSLDMPAQGAQGISDVPSFSWASLPNLGSVRIEIATDPGFNNIVFSETGITGTSYQPSSALDKNTTYYWRLFPTNDCGEAAPTSVSVFRTESLSCTEFSASNLPLNISSIGMAVVEATINSTLAGNVNDVNVKKIKGVHDLVKHIDVSVVSPSGKEVLLFTDLCGNTTQFDLGFDDEAASNMIPCPPTDGLAYVPAENLSEFNNEAGSGPWVIRAAVNNTQGNGGTITDAVIELCSNVATNNPSLTTNEQLCVKPGEQNPINADVLLAGHPNSIPADQLVYTVVEAPASGTLRLGGSALTAGSTFTQQNINDNSLIYTNDLNNSATADAFRFDISGGGGWFGAPLFNILIDAACVTSTRNIYEKDGLTLFPNPAQSNINLRFEESINSDLQIRIFNVQGQLLYQGAHAINGQILGLQTRSLSSGLYIMEVQSEEKLYSQKFNIQR